MQRHLSAMVLTLTLRRSGERLYGVARDPAVGVPVVVEPERASRA